MFRFFQNFSIGDLKKSGWGRAARTDKGVHAIATVINVKLAIKKQFLEEEEPENPPQEENKEASKEKKGNPSRKVNFSKIVNTINSNLKDIRVFGKKKFDYF